LLKPLRVFVSVAAGESLVVGTIFQIGVVIFVAMLLGAIFSKYKQSSIIGYILAGMLLGPFGLGVVQQSELVRVFSELGVLLLMFYIGLELDAQKFRKGGLVAFVLAPAKMMLCFIVGYMISVWFGFSVAEGILIGLVVAISSMAVIGKYLIDNRLAQSVEGNISISILVVEDFVAIVALALLSTLSSQGSVNTVVLNSVFFIVVAMFVVGEFSRYFMRLIEKFAYERHITLYALGMALGLAFVANFFSLSPAIGAFLAGLVLSRGAHSERIRSELETFREFFSVFFFLGIGLAFSPFGWGTLLVALVLLAAYVVASFVAYGVFGTLVGLQPKFAASLGGLMAPVGEFALIIAGLAFAMRTPHASDVLNIAIFLTIATTFLMPYLLLVSPRVASGVPRVSPSFIKRGFNYVSSRTSAMVNALLASSAAQGELMTAFRKLGFGVLSIIGVAYLLLFAHLQFKEPLIAGMPNLLVLIAIGFVLSIPPAFVAARELRNLIALLTGLAFSGMRAEQVNALKAHMSQLFLSFALLVAAFISGVFGLVVHLDEYVAIPLALLSVAIFAALDAFIKIRADREYLEMRGEKKRLVGGGRLRR
ncbi:cation:proton antiporter, partial [Candidatus Micrarchaeota archaeon]|nr:cation:proton antiporter [Candidatus Micrarchaeota archaeon]